MPNRTGTQTIAIDPETVFGTLNAEVNFNYPILQMDFDPAGFVRQVIENPAVSPDNGERIPGAGLQYPDSKVSFKTFAEGLGTAAGDGVTPTLTGISILLGSCLGAAPVVYDGDTVKAASVPTTLAIEETTPGTHAIDTLVAFGFADGHAEVRPVLTYAVDTFGLGMPLTAAPVPGDIIYGGLSISNTEAADAYTIQAEIIGENTAQSFQALGMTGNFTIEQATEQEAQTISWEYMLSEFTPYISGTQVNAANYVPLPIAGSELKMSKAGNTDAPISLCVARISVNLNRTYGPKICADDNETGVAGWVLTEQKAEIKVTVYDDASLQAGFTESTYYDVFGAASEDSNKFQLLFSFGRQVPGSILALYFKQAHLKMDPVPADIDGLGVHELTFAMTSGPLNNMMTLVA